MENNKNSIYFFREYVGRVSKENLSKLEEKTEKQLLKTKKIFKFVNVLTAIALASVVGIMVFTGVKSEAISRPEIYGVGMLAAAISVGLVKKLGKSITEMDDIKMKQEIIKNEIDSRAEKSEEKEI